MIKAVLSNYDSKTQFLTSITLLNQSQINREELIRAASRLYPKDMTGCIQLIINQKHSK